MPIRQRRAARSVVGARDGIDPLFISGLTELAIGALTGWLYALVKYDPEKAQTLGIKSAHECASGTSI